KDASIANLLTDHAGRLWIGTADGTMLRWAGGKFEYSSNATAFLPTASRERAALGWRKDRNWHLIEDSQNRIWWLQCGLAIVHFEENSAKTYTNWMACPSAPSKNSDATRQATFGPQSIRDFGISTTDIGTLSLKASPCPGPGMRPIRLSFSL